MSDNNDVFFDDMPVFAPRQKSYGGGGEKRPENIICYLKPTVGPKDFYVFRLLAFRSKDADGRKSPYIERYIHTKWVTNANGKRFPECTVVCPVTSHVSWARGKDRYAACPICGHADKSFIQFKQSNWKNREAAQIANEFGRKFEGLIPVYVVKDPNNAENNGKLRTIIIGDKKKFDEIIETIEVLIKQGIHVYNGGSALDLYMQFGPVEHKTHEGQPNERIWTKNEITRFRFGNNAYEIPAITMDKIREFPFDAQYYNESTPEELKEFYERYCVPPAGNIDDNFSFDDPPVAVASASNAPVSANASANDADSFDFDAVAAPSASAASAAQPVKAANEPSSSPNNAGTSLDDDLKSLDSELDNFFK